MMKYELEYNQLCHYEQKILQLHAERAYKKFIQEAMSSHWDWSNHLRAVVLDTFASLDGYFTERLLGGETFYTITEVFTPADLQRSPQLCEQIRARLLRQIGRATCFSFGNDTRAEKWFGHNWLAIVTAPKKR